MLSRNVYILEGFGLSHCQPSTGPDISLFFYPVLKIKPEVQPGTKIFDVNIIFVKEQHVGNTKITIFYGPQGGTCFRSQPMD